MFLRGVTSLRRMAVKPLYRLHYRYPRRLFSNSLPMQVKAWSTTFGSILIPRTDSWVAVNVMVGSPWSKDLKITMKP